MDHTPTMDVTLVFKSVPALISIKGVYANGRWVMFWKYDGRYGKPLRYG